ncbi:MAG: helix-turn-helix domain-containing protein [Cyanobium sp. CZS 25K]|nr:helix-turn-helix domain-containing protein [Cyanobium sp. CZS25K]
MAAEDGSAPIPELVQLGERLGQARREQGLSVEVLADRLRLGSEQLMALETGDHRHLPEAVFVVAQAKRVAGALRIDVSQQISDLQESRLMRRRRQPAPRLLQQRPPAAPAQRGRPRSWVWAGLLLLGGSAVAVTALRGTAPSPQAAPASGPSPSPGQDRAPAAIAVAPLQTAADQLRLQTSQPSWLEVRTAAGVTLYRGTFTGEKRFPLGNGLRVLAGRPDLVTASAGSQEPRPLGRIDQVVWRTFRTTPAAP